MPIYTATEVEVVFVKMTKEQLVREVADWVKRAQHEAKLAFAEGDLWSAVAWGCKVPDLNALMQCVRIARFETGGEIDALAERLDIIVRSLDVQKRLQKAFDGNIGHYVMGIDMGKGNSGTALAILYRGVAERVEQSRREFGTGFIRMKLGNETDEKLRERVKEHIKGKTAHLTIIDDMVKDDPGEGGEH